MKFGLVVPNNMSPIKNPVALRTSAQLAEEVDFDSIWVSDHILMPKTIEKYADNTEALMTLAYLAGVTKRVALGTSILVLPMRNPLLAAKQIATLAFLSEREVIIGVGAGWSEDEFRLVNADFKRRGKLTDEYIAILRKLWADADPTHEGTFNFSDVMFSPKVAPVPPIWIGGNSEAAVMRAAHLGDGYQPGMANSPEQYAALIRQLREAKGERPMTFSMSMKFDMRDGALTIIDQMGRYREGGLEYAVVRLRDDTLGEFLRQIEAFSREVIPIFRA